jgi:hypothetical protein
MREAENFICRKKARKSKENQVADAAAGMQVAWPELNQLKVKSEELKSRTAF